MALKNAASGYDSAFEEDERLRRKAQERHSLFNKQNQFCRAGLPSKLLLAELASKDEGKRLRYQMSNLNAYERHKMLINQYVLYHPGSTDTLQRDTSNDKRDIDVIRENHQFLWDSSDPPDTWERQLAKKYFEKLFKEYCICDLSRYKENKVGMRWRIEKEVMEGKGQFMCGGVKCLESEDLRTWEMNFGYMEQSVKKNALVKLRLCRDCSYKVNYYHKRKEVTKKRRSNSDKSRKRKRLKREKEENEGSEPEKETVSETASTAGQQEEDDTEGNLWKGSRSQAEEKSREDEFEEYLEDLFL